MLIALLLPPLFGNQPLINSINKGPYQFHLVTFHGEAHSSITSLCLVIVSSRYCDPVCK